MTDECEYHVSVGPEVMLHYGELSDDALEDNGLASSGGRYLYLTSERHPNSGLMVLAKVASTDAALMLFDALIDLVAQRPEHSTFNRAVAGSTPAEIAIPESQP